MFGQSGVNLSFTDLNKVQAFNSAYSVSGSEQEAAFKEDFKTALKVINSNIPVSSERLIKGNYTMKSIEFERFTEIASRSFSQISLNESEAKEFIGLMNECKLKLQQSQLLNKSKIEKEITEAESKIITHEILDDKEVKIGNINITETIKDEQKKLVQYEENIKKTTLPRLASYCGIVIGPSVIGAGLFLTLLVGSAMGPIGIAMTIVGSIIAGVSVFGLERSKRHDQEKIDQMSQRIKTLVRIREAAKEEEYQKNIKYLKLGQITVLDDSTIDALRGWLPVQ